MINNNTNDTVKEIVQMVLNISEYGFDISNYDYYTKLKDLTACIWEEHHTQLLDELNKLEPEFNLDYQLLWYDSLAFPPVIPKIYKKAGSPQYVFYGHIPSGIDKCEEKAGGFHDANINYAEMVLDTLTLYLDNRVKNVISSDDYQAKLSFKDCTGIFCYETKSNVEEEIPFDVKLIMGKALLSVIELPMIQYIFENTPLNHQYLSTENRLFYMNIEGNNELYIVCSGWEA